MTLSEFKSSLTSYMAIAGYDEMTDLLSSWNGCSEITLNAVDGYNCSLGNVMSTLDTIGVYHELKGLGSDSGMCTFIFLSANKVQAYLKRRLMQPPLVRVQSLY